MGTLVDYWEEQNTDFKGVEPKDTFIEITRNNFFSNFSHRHDFHSFKQLHLDISAMMEKYRLVGEKKSENISGGGEGSNNDICEVKITQQGKPKNYISYAMNLFVSPLPW